MNRGNEIKNWLENHPDIQNYLIIDDEANILEEQKEHFVQTDINEGLTEEHYHKARSILSGKRKRTCNSENRRRD